MTIAVRNILDQCRERHCGNELAVGSVSPYCRVLQTARSPASRTREVFSNEIANRETARVQPFKGPESQCQRWFVATLRWLVFLRQRLGKLSNAYGASPAGMWGPAVVRQIRQVRRLFVRFQRFFPS